MGNHQLAIKDFNKSIEIDPELSEGYYRRGVSKLASKSFHEAKEDFRLSKEYESDDMSERRNAGIPDGLGQCCHALKDYYQALEHYETAIELDGSNTEFLMHRAQCYHDQGQFDLSI